LREIYLNTIPILTPILLISLGSVRDTIHAGGKLTKVPEKKPYNAENVTNPCHVDIPSHPNMRIPAAKTVTSKTFIGPTTSATKFGNIRPNTEAAYVNSVYQEHTFIMGRT
jgi:hypothetical protein